MKEIIEAEFVEVGSPPSFLGDIATIAEKLSGPFSEIGLKSVSDPLERAAHVSRRFDGALTSAKPAWQRIKERIALEAELHGLDVEKLNEAVKRRNGVMPR